MTNTSLNDQYQEIMDRARHPLFQGQLSKPDLIVEGANYSCGDEVHWELTMTADNHVKEARHTARACAVCLAAADMTAEIITGKTPHQIKQITTETILKKIGIPLSPTRAKCAELPLLTLRDNLPD